MERERDSEMGRKGNQGSRRKRNPLVSGSPRSSLEGFMLHEQVPGLDPQSLSGSGA